MSWRPLRGLFILCFNQIFAQVGLIEKSPDVKVMKAINKMLEDWMKNKDVKMLNQGPNLVPVLLNSSFVTDVKTK